MKQEELFKALVKELMGLETMHQEYQDADTQYIVDSQKEGDTLTIKVTFKENKDKQDFEKWIDSMNGDFFNEVWEALSEEDNLHSLDEMYNSENYKEVITKFKNKTKEIASNKIKELQKYLG